MTIARSSSRTPSPAGGVAGALAALGACLLLAAVRVEAAANWTFAPVVVATAEYNDNNRLNDSDQPQIEVSGAGLDALVEVRAETPRSTFRLTPRLRYTFYPGDEEEESDDQFLDARWETRGERTQAWVDAYYNRISTLGRYYPESAVSDDDDLGDPDSGVGVGQASSSVHEDRVFIAPGMSFELAERHTLDVAAQYLDVGHDLGSGDQRDDYAWLEGSLGYGYRWTETARLNLRTVFARYEPEDEDSGDAFGLEGEWTDRKSETAEYFVRLGATRMEVGGTAPGSTDWENGYSGGVGVRWQFEVSTLFFDLTHYLDPSDAGELVARDQLRFSYSRRFTPKLTGAIGARLIQDEAASTDSELLTVTYVTSSVSLEWRMTRDFSLIGRYDYVWREYEDAPTDAQANLASIGVAYRPVPR